MHLPPRYLKAPLLALIAAAPGVARANASDSPAGAALQALTGLAIVVGLIIATAWVMKRLQPGRFAAGGVLKPVAQISLGTRERVVVVEMGDKWLVLGVTAASITTLHTTDKGDPGSAPEAIQRAPFAEWLARARGTTGPQSRGTHGNA